jgi:type IV secretion system protein VirB4
MFHLAEYRRKPDRLADRLPWAALIAPGIVLNKDGSFQRTLAFRGPDLDSSTRAELLSVSARLNNALKRLGSGWCLHIEARRRHAITYPDSLWPDPVTQIIDDERRERFREQGVHFETDYYATFTWLPPEERIGKAGRLFIENAGREGAASCHQHLEFFQRLTGTLASLLEGFMPMLDILDDAATLTYLHTCVSFRPHAVAVPEVPFHLDALLTDSPLLGGLQPQLGAHWLKIISIRAFPSRTIPGLLDGLNALPLEYRWVCRWLPFDKTIAAAELSRLRRQWFAKRKSLFALLREAVMKEESLLEDPEATAKTADADQALSELGEDACAYGYFTMTVTVWDENLTAAADKVRSVQQVLDGLGFVSEVEAVNAVEAWLGSLPGHPYADIRRPIVSSLNLAHMVPMSAIWAGPEMNRHLGGPPLLFAQAKGRTPFRLDLHVSDVGHTMIVGPTGAGKSTLMALICAQFRRYPEAQVYIFDKGASCRALTCAVGGDFFDLGLTDALAFQPLADVDRDEARTFAESWLIDIIGRQNVPITPELKDEVWETLCNLATAPAEERTLTLFVALAQDPRIKEALKTYTHAGPHGRLLDAALDRLAYGSWQAFELEHLMGNRAALIPVLTYLFHRLEQRFTGAPTLLVLDEAWLYLTESFFAARIRDWLKTLRRKNVAVVFATQSLADIAESAIASVLIESCPSRIFLPNDRALDPTTRVLYERFGLNDQQIAMLATATPKRDYYYQSRRGNRLFELGLGPAGLVFCGSSRPEDQQLIAALHAEHGADAFAHALLAAKGHPDLAERLYRIPNTHLEDDGYAVAAE